MLTNLGTTSKEETQNSPSFNGTLFIIARMRCPDFTFFPSVGRTHLLAFHGFVQTTGYIKSSLYIYVDPHSRVDCCHRNSSVHNETKRESIAHASE